MTTIPALYQVTSGAFAEFTARNFTYPLGVLTYITSGTHAGRMKIGDGVTSWNNLQFLVPQATEILLGLIKSSTTHLYGHINANGTLFINGLETDLTSIQDKNLEQDSEISAIKQQLAGMSGTIIYIGGIDKYTSKLTAMSAADRNALLTARAVEIRGQVMDGYTLQDLGMVDEPGRFHYWQYQPDGTWFDLGERGEVSQATDSDLGIVMGSGEQYKVHIEPNGTMTVNGLAVKLSALDDKDEYLENDIAAVAANLSTFQTIQGEVNSAVDGEIKDIKEAAETLTGDFEEFKAAQEENNTEQQEAISAADANAETRVSKAIFEPTHGALVADMAVLPHDGTLAKITKTLVNADDGGLFDMDVDITSDGGSIGATFSQTSDNTYKLNLDTARFKNLEAARSRYSMGNETDGGYIQGVTYYDDEKLHVKTHGAFAMNGQYPQYYYKTYAYVCADIAGRDALTGVDWALCVDGGVDGDNALYNWVDTAWVFVENRAGHDEESSRMTRHVEELHDDGVYYSTALQGYTWIKAPDKAYVDGIAANKVDKESGKGLSTNDYTTDEKTAAADILQRPTSLQTTDPPTYLVVRITVTDGGEGYVVNDSVIISDPPIAATVSAIDGDTGAITALSFDGGIIYEDDPAGTELELTGGSGEGAVCDVRTAYAPGDVQKDGILKYVPFSDPLIQSSRLRGMLNQYAETEDVEQLKIVLDAMRNWSETYLYASGDVAFLGQWYMPNPANLPAIGESPQYFTEKWLSVGGGGGDIPDSEQVTKNRNRIAILWSVVMGGSLINNYTITFEEEGEVIINRGVWNVLQSRLEC
ncbi:MAG: hypothetical protein LBB22_04215 [Treponema sp.]|jgi:hypothetical protein|nr:hypothetical protein [Treponema sp.]